MLFSRGGRNGKTEGFPGVRHLPYFEFEFGVRPTEIYSRRRVNYLGFDSVTTNNPHTKTANFRWLTIDLHGEELSFVEEEHEFLIITLGGDA
jgi:hypothetical protein